jgi:probable rRNA maturation factor
LAKAGGWNELIERVARECAREFGAGLEVSVSLVDDEEMRRLNAKYRGVDSTTDVLSFEQDGLVLGDIVISMEKARAQAEEYGHPLERELAFLTAHGMLHLMGYDHVTEEDAREMFARQDAALKNLGIGRTGRLNS